MKLDAQKVELFRKAGFFEWTDGVVHVDFWQVDHGVYVYVDTHLTRSPLMKCLVGDDGDVWFIEEDESAHNVAHYLFKLVKPLLLAHRDGTLKGRLIIYGWDEEAAA